MITPEERDRRAAAKEAEKLALRLAKQKAREEARRAAKAAKAAEARLEQAPKVERAFVRPDRRWVSLDVATTTGYALWDGKKLVEAGNITPAKAGQKEPWHPHVRRVLRGNERVVFPFRKEALAWRSLAGSSLGYGDISNQPELVPDVDLISYAVFESVHVRFPVAATDLGIRHGRARVHLGCDDDEGPRIYSVSPQEWRRVVADAYLGTSWPSPGKATGKSADRHKLTSCRLVLDQFGIDVGKDHDVAEAILVGVWFIRTQMPVAKITL